jgi:hypothetical protein
MPRVLKIDQANNLVHSIYIGDITDADVIAQVADISLLKIPNGYCELVDLTAVNTIRLTATTIREIAKTPRVFSNRCKRVILVSDSAHYGVGRMVQAYAELSSSASFEVVYSREEAMRLLSLHPDEAGAPDV